MPPHSSPDPLPLIYRVLRGAVRVALRLFFREVAVAGLRHVPRDRGGLLVWRGTRTASWTRPSS